MDQNHIQFTLELNEMDVYFSKLLEERKKSSSSTKDNDDLTILLSVVSLEDKVDGHSLSEREILTFSIFF